VAPAPWRYFSDANELVIATESVSAVSVAVKKSDGTPIITLSAIKGTPAVYRFTGSPTASGSEYYILNTVVSAAGLNITAAAPVSVNIEILLRMLFHQLQMRMEGILKGMPL
jgi:hypothetical protein